MDYPWAIQSYRDITTLVFVHFALWYSMDCYPATTITNLSTVITYPALWFSPQLHTFVIINGTALYDGAVILAM